MPQDPVISLTPDTVPGIPDLRPLETPPSAPVVETPVPEPVITPEPVVAETPPVLTPLDSLPKDGKHTMKALGLHFSGNDIYLRIESTTAFPFKTFSLPTPERLVIDLPGTWTGISAPKIPSNQLVTGFRVGTQPAGPRLVLDLSRKIKTRINRVSDTIVEIVLE